MKKKKILYIHHGKGIGGAPTSMFQLISALDKTRFDTEVLFIYRTEILLEICRMKNIKYRILDSWFFRNIYLYWAHSDAKAKTSLDSLKKVVLFFLNKIRRLLSYPILSFYIGPQILKKEEADIIHLNSLFLTDWLIASKIAHKKTIVHVREPLSKGNFGLRKSYFKFVLNKFADHIFAISKDNLNRIGLPHKTTLLYNSFNISEVESELLNRNDDNLFKLVYLGGSRKIKGIDLIFDISKKLPADVRIFMAGHFNSYDEQVIRESEKLIFIGPTENPYDLIKRSDVLLFPSIAPHFPKPITEAFLFKKPAIASNVKGNDEVVKHYENGILFNPNNSHELFEAIMFFYKNREKCIKFGEKGYQLIKEKFDIKKNIKIVETVYSNLF